MSRPLCDRARRRLFAGAALTSLALPALLLLTGAHDRPQHAPRPAPATTPSPHRPPFPAPDRIPTTTRAGRRPSPGRGDADLATRVAPGVRSQTRRAARRFLTAFLHYELAAATRSERRALATTATPALTRTLLSQPPRPPASTRPRPARLVSLTLQGGDARRVAYLAIIRRGGRRAALEIVLEAGPAGFAVAEVR